MRFQDRKDTSEGGEKKCPLSADRAGLAVLVLVLALTILTGKDVVAADDCVRHFRGIEYCTTDGGQTHIVTVDLTETDVQFDVATASNATGPNAPSWNASLRQTVAQMAATHPTLDGLPLAVAINGDYGASDGSHGWEGFMVQRGVRLDGPTTNAPDCDCASFDRSSLTLSHSRPTRAEIARRRPEELDQYDAYRSLCAGSPAFAGCQAAVLNRTPADDEVERLQKALQDRWYTAVGGGPTIVQDGQVVPIGQACAQEKFIGDWCQDNPQSSPDRMRQLRMGTVAGISADGKYLILIVTTARLPNALSQLLVQQGAHTGLRFDGSESSQMVYNGEEKTGNARRLSNALLVYASLLPADAASLAEPAWPIIALSGDTVQARIVLRNEGSATWRNSDGYALINVKNPLDAPERISLPHDVTPGETATWTLSMVAPETPGPHRSLWQLEHRGESIGERVTIWIGVLPDKSREWKAELDQLIEEAKQKWEEAKQRGEEEIERLVQELIDELERRLMEIIEQKIQEICPCLGSLSTVILILTGMWLAQRRE